jgi:hypothetical protein
MIDSAVVQVATQLNEFLKRHANVAYDIVRTSNLVEQNGNAVTDTDNKLLVFLVNVEKESLPFKASAGRSAGLARLADSSPSVHLNLSVMFAANFSGRYYPDALKFLSNTVSFFQRNPLFDHSNTPDLDSRIDRLVMEIENLSITDLSNLWGIISGKYVPSILYKMRMVTFDARDVISQTPPISATAGSAGPA